MHAQRFSLNSKNRLASQLCLCTQLEDFHSPDILYYVHALVQFLNMPLLVYMFLVWLSTNVIHKEDFVELFSHTDMMYSRQEAIYFSTFILKSLFYLQTSRVALTGQDQKYLPYFVKYVVYGLRVSPYLWSCRPATRPLTTVLTVLVDLPLSDSACISVCMFVSHFISLLLFPKCVCAVFLFCSSTSCGEEKSFPWYKLTSTT